MRRRVGVKIFFKIAGLDISTPLALALDGDSAIFSTSEVTEEIKGNNFRFWDFLQIFTYFELENLETIQI
jgi:hypothetical protein